MSRRVGDSRAVYRGHAMFASAAKKKPRRRAFDGDPTRSRKCVRCGRRIDVTTKGSLCAFCVRDDA